MTFLTDLFSRCACTDAGANDRSDDGEFPLLAPQLDPLPGGSLDETSVELTIERHRRDTDAMERVEGAA